LFLGGFVQRSGLVLVECKLASYERVLLALFEEYSTPVDAALRTAEQIMGCDGAAI
jgi:hypothetical protein